MTGNVGASPTASITGLPPAIVTPPFGLHANNAAAMAAHAANVSLFSQLNTGTCDDNRASAMDGGRSVLAFTALQRPLYSWPLEM